MSFFTQKSFPSTREVTKGTSKISFFGPAKTTPFKTVADNNGSYFGQHAKELVLNQKKDQNSKIRMNEKLVKKNDMAGCTRRSSSKFKFTPILNSQRKEEKSFFQSKTGQKELICFEAEVLKNELKNMALFRLKDMPERARDAFRVGKHAILTISRELELRPETTFQAMFNFHFICTEVNVEKIALFILPCLLSAAKTEEYHPPTVEQMRSVLLKMTNVPTMKNANYINYRYTVEYEAKLILLRNFRIKTPPIMDMANMLLNKLGQYCPSKQFSLADTFKNLLKVEGVFSNSLITIAVAGMRLQETIEKGDENRFFTKVETIIDKADALLYKEYDYRLNTAAIAELISKPRREVGKVIPFGRVAGTLRRMS